MKENKYVEPKYTNNVFTCPYCEVVASQSWSNDVTILKELFTFQAQYFLDYRKNMGSNEQAVITKFLETVRDLFLTNKNRPYALSECKNCSKLAVWIDKKMVHPLVSNAPVSCKDMPSNVKKIYEEARVISTTSPRAAAALLRVVLEKLCENLGEKDGNLYKRIKNLKNKGLSENAIKNLHTVRITANEGGAHAGQIDLTGKDGPKIVKTLFFLVNKIIEKTITDPREEDEAFDLLPKNKTKNL